MARPGGGAVGRGSMGREGATLAEHRIARWALYDFSRE